MVPTVIAADKSENLVVGITKRAHLPGKLNLGHESRSVLKATRVCYNEFSLILDF